MIKIVLYTFNKRENSTKRPTSGLEVTGSIKAPTSMINPTIEFATGQIAPANLNYAYIADFGRYYFIDDWVFNDRTWTARMKVDVLATYKNVIGASRQYVTRSASLWNDKIIDGNYPMTSLTSNNVIKKGKPFIYDPTSIYGGYFVLSTVGADSAGTGACVYLLDTSQMARFTEQLLTTNWYSVDGVADGLMKAISNPIQYINSCFYLPLPVSTAFNEYMRVNTDNVDHIDFGFWSVYTGAKKIKSRAGGLFEIPYNFTFTRHPQISRGEWLNQAPYTERILHIPSVGVVNLDSYMETGFTGVKVTYKLDIVSGAASVVLETFRGIEDVYYSQVGIPVQLTQNTVDYMGAMSATMSSAAVAATNALAGNEVGAAVAAASGIIDAITKIIPQPSRLGGSGCFNFAAEEIFLSEHFHYLADDDLADRGRPLCNDVIISTLNGYIEVADADVEISGTSNENQDIKNYMESGFFYE